MPVPAGVYEFGPANATLTVETARTGAAAKAGHDLVLQVGAWKATLAAGDEASLTLEADATSFRVISGTGGMQALGDDDRASILESIDDDVLKRQDIAFRSTGGSADGERLTFAGDLTIVGTTRPLSFALEHADGGLTGRATVTQSEWGMKPYSILFGALKVADDVEVLVEARLPVAAQ
jgi:polyisoprenoid-binding protein YceI